MKSQKLFIILTNIGTTNFSAVASFIVSYLVLKFANIELWGELVFYLSMVQVGGVIMNWGNKDFLLKEFSNNPSAIGKLWQQNLMVRQVLLLIGVGLLYFFFPIHISFLVTFWMISQFVAKSFEVFIFYQKEFTYSLLTELISVSVIVGLILFNTDNLTIDYLLLSFSISSIARLLLLSLKFKNTFKGLSITTFNVDSLILSFPFFMLTLIGILNSKIDIFCINYAMNKSDLGKYQVLFSFMMLIQGIGYLLVEPFAKNLYRLNESSFSKIKNTLLWSGPVLTIILIGASYLVITHLFHITFDIQNYIAGFFYCIPVFVYGVLVYKLFKINRQAWVVYVSLICLFVNVLLDLSTIPYLGMLGVMVSGALVQWLKLLLFLLVDYLFSLKLKQQKSISA